MRTHNARLWDKDSKEALYVRRLATQPDFSIESLRAILATRPPEVLANIVICLIHQTNFLLDRQLRALEQVFLREGGLREAMTRARLAARDEQRRDRA